MPGAGDNRRVKYRRTVPRSVTGPSFSSDGRLARLQHSQAPSAILSSWVGCWFEQQWRWGWSSGVTESASDPPAPPEPGCSRSAGRRAPRSDPMISRPSVVRRCGRMAAEHRIPADGPSDDQYQCHTIIMANAYTKVFEHHVVLLPAYFASRLVTHRGSVKPEVLCRRYIQCRSDGADGIVVELRAGADPMITNWSDLPAQAGSHRP
eukprot:60147-Hanusia_phi.AAC.2